MSTDGEYAYGQRITYLHFLSRRPVTGTYDSTHPMTGEIRVLTPNGAYEYTKPSNIVPQENQ